MGPRGWRPHSDHCGKGRFVLTFSPDGEFLLVSGAHPLHEFLDIYRLDGTEVISEADIHSPFGYSRLMFSPDGQQLVGQWGDTLYFYDFIDEDLSFTGEVNPPPEGRYPVDLLGSYGWAYHPSGEMVANCSWNWETESGYEVLLWNAQTLSQVVALPIQDGVDVLAFSPDGRVLLGGTEWGEVILWGIR